MERKKWSKTVCKVFSKVNLKNIIIKITSILLCIFHVYTGIFGSLPNLQQRTVHVGLVLILVFISFPIVLKNKFHGKIEIVIEIINFLLIIIAIIFSIYIYFNYKKYLPFMVDEASYFELFLAIASTLIILEATRRTIGLPFVFLTIIVLVYTLFGHFIPGYFGHPFISWNLIFETIYLSANGIWGFLTGLSSTYIALFIIFGTFLLLSGGGQTFTELSILLTGKYKGGPSKVAVISSGLFAMISGSAVANVATTGNFTIPMMKKLGYSSDFAAGVESVASTGGALTPPIMGTAAFVMAEYLNIPYLSVAKAATIPAILFYLELLISVHLKAKKDDLKPVPKQDFPILKDVFKFKKILIFSIPLISLLYLLFSGYSLNKVASIPCLLILALHLIFNLASSFSLKNIKKIFLDLMKLLEEGGKSVVSIVPLLVCANIVLSLINFTGLGVKIANIVMSLGESNVFLSLLLTAILVLVLGTGLPLVAAYVLTIVIASPMLIKLGITPIAAHMFCLYYSVIANITPPLCPAVFMATAIAKSDWLKTAFVSLTLAPILYIIPFIFVFNNSFLLINNDFAIINMLLVILGITLISASMVGYFFTNFNILERIVFFTSGFQFLLLNKVNCFIAIFLFFIGLSYQIYKKKNECLTEYNDK